jgi:hypothetical protein
METRHPVQRFLLLDVWCDTLNLTQIFFLKYTVRRTGLFKLPEEESTAKKKKNKVYKCLSNRYICGKHGSRLVLKMCNNSNKIAFRL